MFINQSFVAITFRLINFVAIIGLAYYGYKKYLEDDIVFQIKKKDDDYQDLLTQQTTLENKQRDLDLLIQQETIECQDFRSKIDEWKKVITLEQKIQEKEYNNLLATAKKRNAEIVLKKENQRIQNTVIDALKIDLEKSLSHTFKDAQKSTDYLDSILNFMNEKIS